MLYKQSTKHKEVNMMVTYGDRDFREWAQNNGLDDQDLIVLRKAASRRVLWWFVLPALTLGVGSLFCAPLMFNAWRVSRWIKKGTLEPRPGLTGTFLFLLLFISFFGIVPLIVWLSIKDNPALPGSGFKKLLRKGKVGNH